MRPSKLGLFSIGLSLCILFIGLVFYGKALALNQQKHQLKSELKVLKKENQRLSLTLKYKKNLEKIEAYAREKLDMLPIKEVIYLEHNEQTQR